jgi:hypothetical protein
LTVRVKETPKSRQSCFQKINSCPHQGFSNSIQV